MASPSNLQELAIDNLKDIYDAEHQLLQAMPEMLQFASDGELKNALQTHQQQTQQQVQRLEQIFQAMGQQPERKKCVGVAGLIQELRQHMQEIQDPQVRDAALIAAAQKGEHYEIAAYGTLCAMAKSLGYKDALPLLLETLEEEKATDEKLTMLAEQGGNQRAAQEAA